jgi:BCD family chlorophyll transporter-like MFS transporter
MFVKRLQLALIHTAIAITLVPINSTLNRVMIKEMAISATLVAVLASLPYLFSPAQVAIGAFSDRHPIFGWRRTPYILIGLLLCVTGVSIAPQVVLLMESNWWAGLGLSMLVFAAWGMGYNFSTVAYLSLATELSGERGRSRTVAVMWFMMIVGIILTAATLSRLLEPFSAATLKVSFEYVGLAALVMGLLGLLGLERRHSAVNTAAAEDRTSWIDLGRQILSAPQARGFFLYMIILLAAILGQDVLLEPFGGEAFGLSVSATTRITSIWGVCVLLAFVAAGLLEKRMRRQTVARFSAWIALVGFLIIAISGLLHITWMFYLGVVLLGVGTGLSTVSNLALMFDMTTTRVGLYMGAWGVSNALARLVGNVTSGAVRDLITQIGRDPVIGYVTVFLIQAGMLLLSLRMLSNIDVQKFRQETTPLSASDKAALMNDAG